MATTESGGPPMATCPLCNEYEGPPSSVEAHISRMTDPVHKGEVGRAHRDHLQGRAGPDLQEDLDGDDDQEPSSESVEDDHVDSEDSDSSGEEVSTGDLGGEPETSTEKVEVDNEVEEVEPLALPKLDTSTMIILIGVVMAITIIWIAVQKRSSEDESQDDEQEEEQEPDGVDPEELEGGLIGQ